MPGRVVVVGLGPAGADHLLPVARARARGRDAAVRPHRPPSGGRGPRRRRDRRSRRSTRATTPRPTSSTRTRRSCARSSTPPASTARSCTRCRAARPSPSARSRCCARRSDVDLVLVPGVSFADLAWVRLGIDPMEGDARVVDGRAIDLAELAGPLLIAQCDSTFVLSDVKLALLEHLDPATPVTVLQRLGLADEQVVTVRARGARSRRNRARPPHLGVRRRRRRGRGARDGAAVPAGQAVARSGRLSRGTPSRPTAPSRATCSRSPTRWWRRSRRCLPTARSTLPSVRRAGGRAGRPALPGRVPRGAGAGVRRVHHGRRRARHPRQARASPPARVRRRGGRPRPATSCATGSRSRRTRRARRRSSRASPPGCRRSSTPTSCSARPRRSASTPAASARPSTASTPRSPGLRAGGDDLEADLAQVLAAAVVVARAGGVDAESALRGWAATYRRPLRGHGAPRRSTATSTSPPSTPPASPPCGSNQRTSGSSRSHTHLYCRMFGVFSRGRRRGWCPCGRR